MKGINLFKIILFNSIFIILILLNHNSAGAYGTSCTDLYGYMAMEDYLTGGCTCISGYVFGKDVLGNTACVSETSVCYDKYGYNSRYNSLTSSCECSYGYVFGKDILGQTSCISKDQACKNQYGYNAKSNFLDKCECRSGYSFGTNVLGETECISSNTICTDKYGYNAEYDSVYDKCVCRSGYELTQSSSGSDLECKSCTSKYGIYSSYNYLSNKCECNNGYTLDNSNQCVKKQNNVYFTLKELDTDERKAIIRSDYDYRYYLISYNSGCYSSTFKRYINHQIIVNLGTDFYLDTWDKIVLQNDNETCDITHKEYADSSTTLVPKEKPSYYLIPEPIVPTPAPVSKKVEPVILKTPKKTITEDSKTENATSSSTTPSTEEIIATSTATTTSTLTAAITNTINETPKTPWYKKIWNFVLKLF